MSTRSVAQVLVELCRQGKNLEAIDHYYADDVVSIEPTAGSEMPAVMNGKVTVRGKNEWWLANHEIHRATASAPMVGDGQCAVYYEYDVTCRPAARPMQMAEMALSTVAGDRIVRERFLYHMPGG